MSAHFIPARRRFLQQASRFAALTALPATALGSDMLLPFGPAASEPVPDSVAACPAPAPGAAADPAELPDTLADAPAPQPASQAAAEEAAPVLARERDLALFHTHTGERIELVYASGERYLPEAMHGLNRFLRDHYSGEVGLMDPLLFDMLHRMRELLGASGRFDVISGYRCPATNGHLRQTRGGGVAKKSLHMEGRAIDVRLPGVALAELHEAALSLRAGGVGYYPGDQFIHLDTGRVRNW